MPTTTPTVRRPRPRHEARSTRVITQRVVLVALASGMVACASGNDPVAISFQPSAQAKLQATAHWQQVARDLALKMVPLLQDRPEPLTLLWTTHPQASVFESELSAALLSELARAGVKVLNHPADDAVAGAVRVTWLRHGQAPQTVSPSKVLPPLHLGTIAPATTDELVVTASLNHGGHLLAGWQTSYYLEPADERLYQLTPAPAPALVTQTLKVTP